MTRYSHEKCARVRMFATWTSRRIMTGIHLRPCTVYSCWRTPVVGSWLACGARYCFIGLSFDIMTTSESFVETDCIVFCAGDCPRIQEVGVTWWRLLELKAHCGNADGLYLHLNVMSSVTFTSRGDQLSAGVLRKNIRPGSKAISAICVLVKCLNTLKTKWTALSVLQERSMSQDRELTLSRATPSW